MNRHEPEPGGSRGWAVVAMLLALLGPTLSLASPAAEALRQVEQAFADSMAQRDFGAFRAFLAADAVFISGEVTDRGREAVAERWAAYFENEEAPFSWAPELVEVLPSGDLGFSSGPVYDASGQRVATFHSVWRLESDGTWRVVFDKGARWCAPSSASSNRSTEAWSPALNNAPKASDALAGPITALFFGFQERLEPLHAIPDHPVLNHGLPVALTKTLTR